MAATLAAVAVGAGISSLQRRGRDASAQGRRLDARRPPPPSATAATRAAPSTSRSSSAGVTPTPSRPSTHAVSDPSNAAYAHYLSPSQFRQPVLADGADVAAVKRFLRQRRLQRRRSLEGADARPRRAARSRRPSAPSTPTFARTASAGTRLIEAAKPVSVPASLAGRVVGIDGLNQALARPLAQQAPPPPVFLQAKPCSKFWAQRFTVNQPRAYGQQQPWIVCGYAGSQMQDAYDVGSQHRARQRRHRRDRGDPRRVRLADDRPGHPDLLAEARPAAGEGAADRVQAVHRATARSRTSRAGTARRRSTSTPSTRWRRARRSTTSAPPTRAPASTTPSRSSSTTTSASIVTNSYGFLGENVGVVADRDAASDPPGGDRPGNRPLLLLRRRRRREVDARLRHHRLPGLEPVRDRGRRHEPRRRPHEQLPLRDRLGHLPRRRQEGHSGSRTSRAPSSTAAAAAPRGCSPSRPTRPASCPTSLSDRYGGHGRVVPDISMDGDPTTGLAVGETQTFPNGKAKYARGPLRRHEPVLAAVRRRHGARRPERGLRPRVRQPGALRARRHGRAPRRPAVADPPRCGAARLRQRRQRVARAPRSACGRSTWTRRCGPTAGYDNVTGIGQPAREPRSSTRWRSALADLASQVRTIAFANPIP